MCDVSYMHLYVWCWKTTSRLWVICICMCMTSRIHMSVWQWHHDCELYTSVCEWLAKHICLFVYDIYIYIYTCQLTSTNPCKQQTNLNNEMYVTHISVRLLLHLCIICLYVYEHDGQWHQDSELYTSVWFSLFICLHTFVYVCLFVYICFYVYEYHGRTTLM